MDRAGGPEHLAFGTDIDVAVLIEGEVTAREGTVIAPALVPDRDVRLDPLFPEPAEQPAGAVGHIPGDGPGLEVEAILRAGDHDPGRLNLPRYARRGCLDIDDDGVRQARTQACSSACAARYRS